MRHFHLSGTQNSGSSPITVCAVIGTRPEAIKLAPVIREMQRSSRLRILTILTGQHREMVDQVMNWFQLTAHHDLAIMTAGQSLTDIVCRSLHGLELLLRDIHPKLLLVQGDTSTAFAAALAAFYQQIPIGHIEAGLRTENLNDPYPEEANRRLISQLATLHFAPTPQAIANLRSAGINDGVYLTGNTVIDALLDVASQNPECSIPGLDWQRYRVLLVTVHRRENWGSRLQTIAHGLLSILNSAPDTAILLPLHRNPQVRNPLSTILGSHPRAFLCEPLEYPALIGALQRSTLVLTDSGGLQEEAPTLGKPVLVLRETTERPEAIQAGVAQLVGTNSQTILSTALQLLNSPPTYEAMAQAINPYGDGNAAVRIVQAISAYLASSDSPNFATDIVPGE